MNEQDKGKLWSFLRTVLSQGGDIMMDYNAGRYKSYEEYSIRLDCAARERADHLLEMSPSPPEAVGETVGELQIAANTLYRWMLSPEGRLSVLDVPDEIWKPFTKALDNPPSSVVGEAEKVKGCSACGSKLVFIRGKYPGMDNREICPTYAYERLEHIAEIANPDYGKAYSTIPNISNLSPNTEKEK